MRALAGLTSRRSEAAVPAESTGLLEVLDVWGGYGSGDVIFFKEGAHAKWQVEGHVRKLAFCRRTQPVLFSLAVRAFSKIKRTLTPGRQRKVESLTG